MSLLLGGSLVEVVEQVWAYRHPTEARGLDVGDRFVIDFAWDDKVKYRTFSGPDQLGTIIMPACYVRPVPTVGFQIARDELTVTHLAKDEWFVYRRDNTVLCYGYTPSLAPFKMYRPILWPTHAAADKWVKEGCFADLQEGLGNLDVQFTNVLLIPPKEWP